MVSWESVLGLDFGHAAVAFGSAFLAGAINSVAGGGTLVSFPALIWLGLGSVTANATSTVAIWPGTVGSIWGYRRELRAAEPRFRWLIVPSLVGGLTGALLLRWTPPAIFDRMVPFLILFATLLFMAQEPIQRILKTDGRPAHRSANWFAGVMVFQLMVGLYGGYFGAGIGILMVAAVVGGYGGAGVARKIGRTAVRRIVIAIGLGMAVSLFIKK